MVGIVSGGREVSQDPNAGLNRRLNIALSVIAVLVGVGIMVSAVFDPGPPAGLVLALGAVVAVYGLVRLYISRNR